MTLYRLAADPPSVQGAVMVASLDGWVDAAEAASSAVGHLAQPGRVVATFDPDALFDYRDRRPVLDVVDGRLAELRWPELTMRHVRLGDRDLLVFSGAEPDLRWQELARDVVELARLFDVSQWVSLGAVPAAVPHTRPVPVMTTASRDGLLGEGGAATPAGLLRVPAAALSALEMEVTAAGVPAVGFFAQVPPYASIGYAAASLALLDRLGRHLGVAPDVTALLADEREQREQYDHAVENDALLAETVARLESVAGPVEAERLPSGDELAREIERFLRGQSEGGPPAG